MTTSTGASGRTEPETVTRPPLRTRRVRTAAFSAATQPTVMPGVTTVDAPGTATRARTRPAFLQVTAALQVPSAYVVARASVTQRVVPRFWTSTSWPAI